MLLRSLALAALAALVACSGGSTMPDTTHTRYNATPTNGCVGFRHCAPTARFHSLNACVGFRCHLGGSGS